MGALIDHAVQLDARWILAVVNEGNRSSIGRDAHWGDLDDIAERNHFLP